jgi:hypothetical protein
MSLLTYFLRRNVLIDGNYVLLREGWGNQEGATVKIVNQQDIYLETGARLRILVIHKPFHKPELVNSKIWWAFVRSTFRSICPLISPDALLSANVVATLRLLSIPADLWRTIEVKIDAVKMKIVIDGIIPDATEASLPPPLASS